MASVLPFDEINALVGQSFDDAAESGSLEKVTDDLLAILIQAYRLGIASTAESLSVEIEDEIDELYEIVFARIDGITFEDRAEKHFSAGDKSGLLMLAGSEAHRVFETAAFKAAGRASASYNIGVGKMWQTMMDDRVRETHDYLQSRVVGLNEEFYTFDGDHAYFPGGFTDPSNNVNCRCHVRYVRSAGLASLGQGSP